MARLNRFRHPLRQLGLAVPLLFLWGMAFGLTINALSTLVDRLVREIAGLQSELWHAVATFLVTILLLAVIGLLVLWRLRPATWVPYSGMTTVPKKAGLIILVSREDSALYAIHHHLTDGPLRKVWLIPSAVHSTEDASLYGESSRPVAEAIRARALAMAKEAGKSLEVIIHPTGVSPSDSQATFDCVRRILRERHLPATEIAADFTGGTKPMTIGLVMACLSPDVPLEYVPFNLQAKVMNGPFFIDYRSELFDL